MGVAKDLHCRCIYCIFNCSNHKILRVSIYIMNPIMTSTYIGFITELDSTETVEINGHFSIDKNRKITHVSSFLQFWFVQTECQNIHVLHSHTHTHTHTLYICSSFL